jgi:hypothetical protein
MWVMRNISNRSLSASATRPGIIYPSLFFLKRTTMEVPFYGWSMTFEASIKSKMKKANSILNNKQKQNKL